MKKHKSSLTQRMLAVLLSAVLTVGMVSNAMPVNVLAQEGVQSQDGDSARKDGDPENRELGSESGEPGNEGGEGESGGSGNEGGEGESGGSGNEGGEGESGGSGNEGGEGESGGFGNEGGEGESGGSGNKGGEDESGESGNMGGEGGSSASGNDIGEGQSSASENDIGEGEPEESEDPEESTDAVLQALLERIAVLPDVQAYLEEEPATDDYDADAYEEAYGNWEERLYEYAEEALALWEECEQLTDEQRAQVPEEGLAKLEAWLELAAQLSDNGAILTAAAVQAAPGSITADQEWDTQTLAAGTYTISPGVTVTLKGMTTIEGEVTIQGGGKLVRGDGDAYISVSGSGKHLTLGNIEVDGKSYSSGYSLIAVSGGGQVTLGDGCRIHHCIKNSSDGGALNLNNSSAVFENATIENCQATSYGGAIYMDYGSSLTIRSGTYRDNGTTATTSYGGGFIYNRMSTLKIYGGSYIGNTSKGKAGCIYNTGKEGTQTYLYGGYFQGNQSSYSGYEGSGAVLYSSENTAETILNLSGNLKFCGDGDPASGVDGVFLDFAAGAVRKAQISSELKYTFPLYLKAEEGRVIAEGVDGYRLQKKDMKKLSFFDTGSSGQAWYAKLDEANNQVILTATDPGYSLYVTYGANGGEGDVSDSREYTSGDTVTVQPGTALHRDGYAFDGWNTRPDGTGVSYAAGSSFAITEDMTLYAQWKKVLPLHSHSNITFTPWESTDSLPTAAGNYYLTGNVTMSGKWAPAGTTSLCLNGYQVKYTGATEKESFIWVQDNVTLNLYDCNGSNGNHTFTSPATGESVTIQGGLITGSGQKNVVGSGIRIYAGGTCNLYGGSIAGFSDTPGSGSSHGAVRVEGTFHMYGGAITHNRSGCGGGVNICMENNGAAYFCLHSGSISYNYADYDDGGGICINDTGSFEMTGGEIKGNKAKSGGGGIHWYNDNSSAYTVQLSGGAVTENTTGGEAGGAVRFEADPGRQFFVSGGIKITGNQNKDGKESNLYLADNFTIGVDSSGLSSGAAIGVTTASAPTEQTPIAVTGHNKGDYSKYFQSDNPAYEIRNDSDTVKLFVPHRHTPKKYDKVSADCTHPGTGEYWKCEGSTGCGKLFSDQECTKEISEKPVLSALGHSYEESTWEKDADGHWHECSRCGDKTVKSEHGFGSWQHDVSGHWKSCTDCGYQTAAAAHTYDDASDMNCNDCGYNRTASDKTPPTGSITAAGHTWTGITSPITFDLFFNEAKPVTIQGQDTAGSVCSGLDKIYYHVSGAEMNQDALKGLGDTQWTEGTSVDLEPGRNIVYAMIRDKAGNQTYLSTNGLVYDTTPPEIIGVTGGAVYRKPQTVTVKEENLKNVTVNGTTVTLTDNSFTLGAASGPQTIAAEDKAGNRSTVTVTVKTAAENVSDAKKEIEAALENVIAGNRTTEEDVRSAIEDALKKAGISGEEVTFTLEDFTKTEATTENTGSLRGTVAIVSSQDGSVTDSVELDKTIPNLPVSDADKVAAAKTVVEKVLAGITVSNGTTKEQIQDAIDTALSKAGITDVTVTVDDFTKTDATTSKEGSVGGRISISCGSDSDSVAVSKKIEKLPAAKYTVTVNNGTGSGEYEAGVTVTISAGAPASGKQFDKWAVNEGSVTLDNAKSSTTSFTMPEGAVTVTATYKNKTGGSGSGGGGNSGGDDNHGGGSGDNGGGSGSGGSDNSGGGSGSGGNGNSGSGNADGGNNGGDNSNGGGNGNAGGSGGNGNQGGGKNSGADAGEAPEALITTPQEDLERAVLTETEKQQKADGADIRIELDIEVLPAEAGPADRALVEKALNSAVASGYTLGQYLDISLYKVIGDSRTAIRETDGKITVRIDVPDHLRNTDPKNIRTFAVIRVHDGRTELLTDLDNDPDTVTIATDRFSTYALLYQDTENGSGSVRVSVENGGGKTSGGGKDGEPKTGDSTPIELCATLSMIAGFTYLLLYFADRRRGMSEETKKELVSSIIGWAKRGGRIRRYLALAAIFFLLVYYHSIGKKLGNVQSGALNMLQSP